MASTRRPPQTGWVSLTSPFPTTEVVVLRGGRDEEEELWWQQWYVQHVDLDVRVDRQQDILAQHLRGIVRRVSCRVGPAPRRFTASGWAVPLGVPRAPPKWGGPRECGGVSGVRN